MCYYCLFVLLCSCVCLFWLHYSDCTVRIWRCFGLFVFCEMQSYYWLKCSICNFASSGCCGLVVWWMILGGASVGNGCCSSTANISTLFFALICLLLVLLRFLALYVCSRIFRSCVGSVWLHFVCRHSVVLSKTSNCWGLFFLLIMVFLKCVFARGCWWICSSLCSFFVCFTEFVVFYCSDVLFCLRICIVLHRLYFSLFLFLLSIFFDVSLPFRLFLFISSLFVVLFFSRVLAVVSICCSSCWIIPLRVWHLGGWGGGHGGGELGVADIGFESMWVVFLARVLVSHLPSLSAPSVRHERCWH